MITPDLNVKPCLFSNITLSDSDYYCSGRRQDVYIHPHNNSFLIKLLIKDRWKLSENRRRLVRSPSWLKHYKDVSRQIGELAEFIHLKQRGEGDIYQKIVAFCETNKGVGLVVLAYKDKNNNIAPTLRSLINQGGLSAVVVSELRAFLRKIYHMDICFNDFHTGQVVYYYNATLEQYQFILVDGIGKFPLMPVRSKAYSRYRLRRRIKKVCNNINVSSRFHINVDDILT